MKTQVPNAVREVKYPVELSAHGDVSGRVVGDVHYKQLCLRRDVLGEEVHIEAPAPARNLQRPLYHLAAERARQLVERGERRVHDDHFVARLQHVVHEDEDTLFGGELQDVGGAERGVAFGDRLTQGSEARRSRVSQAQIVPEFLAFRVGHIQYFFH